MKPSHGINGLRHIAKALTLLIFILLLYTILYDKENDVKPQNLFSMSPLDTAMTICAGIGLIGLVIAWWREYIGGSVTFLALILFSVFYYLSSGGFLLGIWIMALPATLFMIHRKISDSHDHGPDDLIHNMGRRRNKSKNKNKNIW